MKVADLFCGMGGFSYGFKKAGYDIVYGIDNDKDCVDTFKLNNPEAISMYKDIRKIINVPFSVDIVIGSPPCQPFSIATKSESKTLDLSLVNEFFRLVKLFKAKYWIMENVVQLKSLYNHHHVVLDSSDFLVPQKRTRVFFSNFFLNPKKTGKTTVQHALNLKSGSFMLDSRMARFSKNKERVRIEVDKPSPTLTTKCNGLHILEPSKEKTFDNVAEPIKDLVNKYESNFSVRRISIDECLILQGFDFYKFPDIRKSKIYHMIGNSVCPPVAEAIAKCKLGNLYATT